MDHVDTIKYYSKYSEEFDKKIGSLVNYDQSYLNFIQNARVKSSLLDLASGPGNVADFIRNKIPGIQVTCADLSPEMLEIARNKIPDGQFYIADLSAINIPPRKYDLITCAFGLPYIAKGNIMNVVEQIVAYSHNNSSIYISCMQGDKTQTETLSFGGQEKVLVHYHKKNTVVDAFEQFNCELIDYQDLEYKEQDGTVTIDMIFCFQKKNA